MANTKKQLKVKLVAAIGLLVLALVVGVDRAVLAYTNQGTGQPATVIENAGGVTINNPVAQPSQSEDSLGALTPGFSPSSPVTCINGDCTYYLNGSFLDASTTIFVLPDPFLTPTTSPADVILEQTSAAFGLTGATSTVFYAQVDVTGASTSTAENIQCGASATSSTLPTLNILYSANLTTSTVGTISSGTASSTLGGVMAGGSTQRIYLTPARPYFVCGVTAVLSGGFVGANNTFDGKVSVRISHHQ